MAFLTVKQESVEAEGGSGYITKSGIYDLTLKHCEITTTTNGAVQANYYFDKVNSFGNNIIGIQGQPTFGYKVLEALAAIIGEEELSDPEATTVKFKTKSKELMCIPELNDIQVKAWVQVSYRMYKGEIRENISIRRFYRSSDNASGSEVLTGKDIGERHNKDLPLSTEIKYEEGATADAVAAWKKAQQSGSSAPATATKASTGGFPGTAGTGFPGA
jgi:hypothetical protein